jgi:hypothetical protein
MGLLDYWEGPRVLRVEALTARVLVAVDERREGAIFGLAGLAGRIVITAIGVLRRSRRSS